MTTKAYHSRLDVAIRKRVIAFGSRGRYNAYKQRQAQVVAAVTGDQANEVFDSLSGILRSSGLGWVVDQVDEELRVGRIVPRELHPVRSPQIPLFDPRTASRGGSLVGTLPYTDHERLRMLLDAGALVLRHCAALEGAIGQFFPVVLSAPDLGVAGPEPRQISGHAGRDAADRILPLLDELKRRLDEP